MVIVEPLSLYLASDKDLVDLVNVGFAVTLGARWRQSHLVDKDPRLRGS